MAKVTGPLYSMSASGKIGNAMVFFGWKGTNVVRQWLKPVNKMTGGQGDQRIVFGGTGRAVGEIKPEFQFAQQLIDLNLIPGGQTKQSFMVKYIIDHYLSTPVLYAAELSALAGHTAAADFASAAEGLGIVDFDLSYASVDAYVKGLGLYLIAKAAIALGFVGAPYTTALASWTSTEIDAMVADFTT